MDDNKNTSIPEILAASIIMTTSFSDQDRHKEPYCCDGNVEERGRKLEHLIKHLRVRHHTALVCRTMITARYMYMYIYML